MQGSCVLDPVHDRRGELDVAILRAYRPAVVDSPATIGTHARRLLRTLDPRNVFARATGRELIRRRVDHISIGVNHPPVSTLAPHWAHVVPSDSLKPWELPAHRQRDLGTVAVEWTQAVGVAHEVRYPSVVGSFAVVPVGQPWNVWWDVVGHFFLRL